MKSRVVPAARRVNQLGRTMLPRPSPTGSYSTADYDRTLGFVLLAHAELEACMEDIAAEAAVECFDRWAHQGHVTPWPALTRRLL